MRLPAGSSATETDGWRVTIGDLGKGRPTIQVWLDRFAGKRARTLSAWFEGTRDQIKVLTQRVEKRLTPVRVITVFDTEERKHLRLQKPLKETELELPFHEKHREGETFFGIYGRVGIGDSGAVQRFVFKASDFFVAVASAQRRDKEKLDNRETYPKEENRKVVALHLRRERSGWLATQCKERDNYTCTVCSLHFPDRYGPLGQAFAEAHHLVPLSKVKKCVMTKIDDLATVCANCHRMLHRMDGDHGDVAKLRKIVACEKRRRKP
ncbi:MAG: HNH endonuclease [Opitutaceae bacterium]